jgi:hypothetical protein
MSLRGVFCRSNLINILYILRRLHPSGIKTSLHSVTLALTLPSFIERIHISGILYLLKFTIQSKMLLYVTFHQNGFAVLPQSLPGSLQQAHNQELNYRNPVHNHLFYF